MEASARSMAWVKAPRVVPALPRGAPCRGACRRALDGPQSRARMREVTNEGALAQDRTRSHLVSLAKTRAFFVALNACSVGPVAAFPQGGGVSRRRRGAVATPDAGQDLDRMVSP